MVHVEYLAIFPVVVVNRTHIGGRPADVTADLLRRLGRCSVGDNGQENPMSHFWSDGTTVATHPTHPHLKSRPEVMSTMTESQKRHSESWKTDSKEGGATGASARSQG